MDDLKFLSYGRQDIDQSDIDAVIKVLKSNYLTQGPEVQNFEEEIKKLTGAKYCVAVSSATAALHMAVLALELPDGSEGITSPNTFLASANCMVYGNIKPKFADIDAFTYNISPLEIKKQITEKTKLVIPVHFAGQPADMPEIKKIANQFDLKIIEDAAHAIGSINKDGSTVGSCKYSDMTVFSFHPVKTITTGEGGAITTNDTLLYKKLLRLRSHGMTKDPEILSQNPGPWYYEMIELGYNFRLTDIQAALGISQLKKLDSYKIRRREIIEKYNNAFKGLNNLITPKESEGLDSCFHLYVVKINFETIGFDRNYLMEKLKEKGIGTQVHYIPVHLQPFYRKTYGFNYGDFPNCEGYYKQALSLPLYPAMSNDDVSYVIKNVKELIK